MGMDQRDLFRRKVTNGEADRLGLCMECGNPGATTYKLKLPVERMVRVCDRCRPDWDEWFRGAEEVRP
jgi:hypothetical protein